MYVEIKSPNEAIRCVENYWLHNFFPQQLFELSFLENRCFSYYLESFKILKICFVFYRVPQLNGICRKRQWRWLLLWLKRSKFYKKIIVKMCTDQGSSSSGCSLQTLVDYCLLFGKDKQTADLNSRLQQLTALWKSKQESTLFWQFLHAVILEGSRTLS